MLLAKVRAILRRVYGELARSDPGSKITVDQLTLQLDQMSIQYRGENQSLTKNECKLLQLFMSRPGVVITRDECLEALWDDLQFVDDNTLTVNVTRVRRKLAKWGLAERIETKRGVGYRWQVEDRP
jgi:DNA-binding response OmpR family regulator